MDQIVTIANGNIQKYEKISEIKLPNGNYATSLRATVSVDKLRSFVQSKGISVEFNGGVFAMNMAMQEMYKENELIAWKNTRSIIDQLIPLAFDYKLDVLDPVMETNGKYRISLTTNAVVNNNYITIIDVLSKYLVSVSMSKMDAENYKSSGHKFYTISINDETAYLRNEFVTFELLKLPWQFAEICASNFYIKNNLDDFYSFKPKGYYDSFLGIGKSVSQKLSFPNYTPPIEVQFKKTDVLQVRKKNFYLLGDFGNKKYTNDIFKMPITIDEMKYRTADNSVIHLLYAKRKMMSIFLYFHLTELKDINQIKNIKEYKIELDYIKLKKAY
jgi:hypothetical protein